MLRLDWQILMGLDNRDYLRDESRRYSSGGSFGSMGPSGFMCQRILIVTIAVFVLQIFTTRPWTSAELDSRRNELIQQMEQAASDYGDPDGNISRQIQHLESTRLNPTMLGLPQRVSLVQEWLELDTPKVFSGQIWRLLTCALCHDRLNLMHILFNMLFLWWFGPRLESMYGSKEFLLFYITAALTASVSYIAIDLVTGDPVPMIGASGAIMAIVTLYAIHYPTQVIYVMFFIPVEIRWMVLIYAVFDLYPLLLELSGEGVGDNVAHAAHLGGLAFGYFYGRKQFRLQEYLIGVEMWWKAKRRGLKIVGGSSGPTSRSQRLADEMDAILQKISEHGEASLTADERRTLERASRELRDRRS